MTFEKHRSKNGCRDASSLTQKREVIRGNTMFRLMTSLQHQHGVALFCDASENRTRTPWSNASRRQIEFQLKTKFTQTEAIQPCSGLALEDVSSLFKLRFAQAATSQGHVGRATVLSGSIEMTLHPRPLS